MIDFLNSKSSQELRTMQVEDRTQMVLEINKMVQKNMYRKTTEVKLGEIKGSVMKFNTNFDKRMRVGFPSCQDQQGNFLPWKTYETILVEAKRKIDSSQEKTTILKGSTIVNYLHKDFQMLWLIKTLFTENPSYSQMNNFRMVHTRFIKCPSSNIIVWKKCKAWMSPTTIATEDGPSTSEPAQESQVIQ